MTKWQPIETAPKEIVSRTTSAEYGHYILAYPARGGVSRVRWWQTADKDFEGWERYQNFLDDGGCASHPTHWMPLPEPPK